MASKYVFHVGDKFGSWEVISLDSKSGYVKCRCVCGKVRDVNRSTLARGVTISCGCSRKEELRKMGKKSSALQWEKARRKVGTTINGFKILSVEKRSEDGTGMTFCKILCPICGKESETLLSRLPRIHVCVHCNRNTTDLLREMHSVSYVGGSSLPGIKSRLDGKVNKNSKTKVNGVSQRKDGRYRAYLNFRRKQYHLGLYDTIEEAIAARKEGERKIFGEYFKNHEGWEEELKEIGKKHRKISD